MWQVTNRAVVAAAAIIGFSLFAGQIIPWAYEKHEEREESKNRKIQEEKALAEQAAVQERIERWRVELAREEDARKRREQEAYAVALTKWKADPTLNAAMGCFWASIQSAENYNSEEYTEYEQVKRNMSVDIGNLSGSTSADRVSNFERLSQKEKSLKAKYLKTIVIRETSKNVRQSDPRDGFYYDLGKASVNGYLFGKDAEYIYSDYISDKVAACMSDKGISDTGRVIADIQEFWSRPKPVSEEKYCPSYAQSGTCLPSYCNHPSVSLAISGYNACKSSIGLILFRKNRVMAR